MPKIKSVNSMTKRELIKVLQEERDVVREGRIALTAEGKQDSVDWARRTASQRLSKLGASPTP